MTRHYAIYENDRLIVKMEVNAPDVKALERVVNDWQKSGYTVQRISGTKSQVREAS